MSHVMQKSTRLKQDIGIIAFFALLSIVIGYVVSDRIGFFVAFIGVLYGLLRSCKDSRIAIIMLMVMAYDYFGLVPFLSIGSGTLHWFDVGVAFAFIMGFRYLRARGRAAYGFVFVIYFIFIGIACVQSFLLYHQSIFTTLASTRSAFILFSYWPISKLLNNERIDQDWFLATFEKVCKVALILYWLQFIVVNAGINITYLPTKVRWGTRIYISFTFVILYFFYNFYYLVYSRDKSKNRAIQCAVCVLTLAIVAQSRSSMVYIAAIALLMTFLSMRGSKIFKYVLLVGIIGGILFSVPMTRNIIISSALETTNNDSGSIAYRSLETRYYSEQLVGNEILGVGIPNKHDVSALDYSGRRSDQVSVDHKQFNLTDLGAFKIRYQFGIIAYVLYFVMLFGVLIKNLKGRAISAPIFAAISMIVYLIIDSGMIEMLTRVPFIFMLLLVFLDVRFAECKNLR